MVFQKVGIRFEADKDEYPLRGMLPRFAGLHIPQHNSIDFFVALYLLNHRVPDDVGFWVVEDLVLKNLLRSKLGSAMNHVDVAAEPREVVRLFDRRVAAANYS